MIKFIDKIINGNKNLFIIAVMLVSLYFFLLLFGEANGLKKFIGLFINFYIAAIVCYNIIKAGNAKSYWIAMCAAIFFWAICDVVWFLFWKELKDELFILETFYMLPRLLIFLVVCFIYYRCVMEISSTQMVVDAIFIGIICFSFFILIVFNDGFKHYYENINFILNGFFLLLGIVAIFMSVIIYLSVKNLSKDKPVLFLLLFLVVYTIYDVIYSFANISGSLLANTILEILLHVSFLVAMFGSFYVKNDKELKFIPSYEKENIKLVIKMMFFLVIPMIANIYTDKVGIVFITFTLFLMVFYVVLTHNISSTIYNKEMIKREQESNIRLNKIKKERLKELNEINKKLTELSKYDFLTKAYNRPYFISSLSELIFSKLFGESIGLYMLDISHFKAINNTYGHYIGDEVLVKVVQNLKAILPANGIIGRFGGDDLLIAVKGKTSKIDNADFAMKIINQIQIPLVIEGKKISVSAKIGVSFTQTSQIKVEDLISQATIALNIAKDSLSEDYFRYNEELSQINWKEYYIKTLLDLADYDKEFRLVYQPQFNINTKELIGAEALLRWVSPVKGAVSPAVFIPVAEQSPAIIHIGKWVLNKAINQIKEWNEKYNTNISVSINVSPKQIDSVNFANNILNILKEKNVNPKWITIEITEMSWIGADDVMQEILSIFQANGINVSIDDFGTGFSSISYLKKFDINKIKIAKELVDDIKTDKVDRSIIMAIVSLAKDMGIKTIAEGVEHQDQLNILKNIGCDELQGYIYSKPLEVDDFEKFLAHQTKISIGE